MECGRCLSTGSRVLSAAIRSIVLLPWSPPHWVSSVSHRRFTDLLSWFNVSFIVSALWKDPEKFAYILFVSSRRFIIKYAVAGDIKCLIRMVPSDSGRNRDQGNTISCFRWASRTSLYSLVDLRYMEFHPIRLTYPINDIFTGVVVRFIMDIKFDSWNRKGYALMLFRIEYLSEQNCRSRGLHSFSPVLFHLPDW